SFSRIIRRRLSTSDTVTTIVGEQLLTGMVDCVCSDRDDLRFKESWMNYRRGVYVFLTVLSSLTLAVRLISAAQQGMPDDGASHPPPATGPYMYNGFVSGSGYVDPSLGGAVGRVTSDHRPDDIYSHNKVWNADGTRYLHLDQIIDVSTGLVEYTRIPLGAYSYAGGFDPVDPDALYYQQGPNLRKITLSGGSWTDSIYFTAPNGATLLSLGGESDWVDANGRYMLVRYGAEPSVYLYNRQ